MICLAVGLGNKQAPSNEPQNGFDALVVAGVLDTNGFYPFEYLHAQL